MFEALAARVALQWPAWRGFGLAIQVYQTRALDVVNEVARIARAQGLRFVVRLIKGAYWDAEIKRAQEPGLAGYPVCTRKQHTDLPYLACARAMLNHADVIYPQFATHNAGMIAAIAQMAQPSGALYDLQRLHGMGAGVYREVMQDPLVRVRVYAPVGEHRDLLAYLVRRLLDNGANSSFVHQLADESIAMDQLLASPLVPATVLGLPLPVSMFGWRADLPGQGRPNSSGLDLACMPLAEPGPTGERNELRRFGRGLFVCISPWRSSRRRTGGRRQRVARASRLRSGAERLPQRWSALLSVAPVVCARKHCRRRDRDDSRRPGRADRR